MTEIIVREAEPKDAQNLINFLNQVGKESHFLTLDEVGILMTATQMSEYLAQIAEKDNNAYLLALIDGKIAGVISLTADFHERIRHIGDLFIAVSQNFQGYGIGHILISDMLDFIQEVGIQGLLIGIFTMVSYHIGLNTGNHGLAMTMAFSTLCLARLFHGFNCHALEKKDAESLLLHMPSV